MYIVVLTKKKQKVDKMRDESHIGLLIGCKIYIVFKTKKLFQIICLE